MFMQKARACFTSVMLLEPAPKLNPETATLAALKAADVYSAVLLILGMVQKFGVYKLLCQSISNGGCSSIPCEDGRYKCASDDDVTLPSFIPELEGHERVNAIDRRQFNLNSARCFANVHISTRGSYYAPRVLLCITTPPAHILARSQPLTNFALVAPPGHIFASSSLTTILIPSIVAS